ncbi:MAG TPA: ABC transporter substrate-binding protein [Candidatus Nitrosotalea sp.]|nr:ABC transporter substrate-binding protein [Candidatus Nitrosotalea sp.]
MAVAMSSLIVITACGGQNNPTTGTTYKNGQTLTVRLATDWTNFDIQVLPSLANTQLVLAAYDRLLDYDSGKVVPYLATSWTQTPTSLSLVIRTDAKCSDGTPVTPTVIANSFKRLIDPSTKFRNSSQLFGTGPYTVAADDAAHTFTFTTSLPFSNLLYGFTDPATAIICPAGLVNPSALQTGMYGSGPYTLTSAVHNDRLEFSLRSDWAWGPKGVTAKTPGMPGKLVYKIVADETTAANLLQTGGLTLAMIAGPDIPRLIADKTLAHAQAPVSTSQIMVFNQAPGHVTVDQTVREALMTAIDPSAYCKAANSGYCVPTTSYLAKSALCFDPKTASMLPKPDIAAAKAILTKAGYTAVNGVMTKDGKPLTINLLGGTFQNSGPDYLLAQFQSLGANVVFTKVDFAAYAANLQGAKFTWDVTVAALTSAASFSPLPSNFAVPFMSGKTLPEGGRNIYWIRDPVIEDLVGKALATTGTGLCPAWAAVQERYLAQHDFLPLGSAVDQWFSRNVQFQTDPVEPLTWRITG